ncbi:hypothetical protein LINGRAHAP2_LOCUS21570, partial [Linum grandiflorum]
MFGMTKSHLKIHFTKFRAPCHIETSGALNTDSAVEL